MDSDVIIIGAGVSGLCAATYLSQELGEKTVLTLEAGPRPGGTTGSDHADGFICDWGSNGFLDREPLTLEWAALLGLTPRLERANEQAAKRFIYRAGALHRIKPPPGFFLSPLLSPWGRLRLCCEPLAPARRDPTPESIHDFAARRIGAEAAQMLVGAMVLGIYGGDARQLSMEHCFPRMVAMERDHGGLFKALLAIRRQRPGASPMGPPGTLTTFRGGIGVLPETAAARLADRVRYDTPATAIHRRDGGYTISLASGETLDARAVVVATPAHAAARLTQTLHPPLASALNDIPYVGLNVVCAGYAREDVDHGLDGFGFLVPRGQDMRLLGCIWTSSLFPFQAPDGQVLLRVMYGGAPDPEVLSWSDEELAAAMQRELHPLLRIRKAPHFLRVFRHPRGIPQYTLGHETRLRAVAEGEQALPGISFIGNAYRGIGLNDCVVSAHRSVKKTLEYLGGLS